MPTPSYLVFADVDETLINCKSMFDFLQFRMIAEQGIRGGAEYLRIRADVQAKADAGVPREEINRSYYSLYAGEPVDRVAELAARWFAERDAAGLFIESTEAALRDHRARGATIVLVSGSFPALLAPVADRVGAAHLLCTRPLEHEGRYTGEVEVPVIGEAKADAVRTLLAAHPGVDPSQCYAYGDHTSDIPMMNCVGIPVVVGDHPEMKSYLAEREVTALRLRLNPLRPTGGPEGRRIGGEEGTGVLFAGTGARP
ncbi:HAD family hydrolase [Streptomyces yaizuensis]|uniref:HAD-IB family hydrolase n=1 Tax=Streptomyces yaizuensis TaxID=2989713 RepID=A0ABQ5P9Q8_9ACTN|nr:HAD-IB family hydrolase [Streptomyces sp. YSPA8]GLF99331.1 HAD-IB family hydrolase [Streptomyces sp. YSPA8]